ncbi:hypothetical protein, partial [Klebsiella pneumoniae]
MPNHFASVCQNKLQKKSFSQKKSKEHPRYRRRTDVKQLDEETESDGSCSDQSNQAFAIEEIR